MHALYYSPMACSLASRIALEEAGMEARYHRVDLATKRLEDGANYRTLSPKGKVPALITDDGALITEGPAVLQYIADRVPASDLAPPPGSLARYELQSWLNFISTELHKQLLALLFGHGVPEAVRDYVRGIAPKALAPVTDHLAGRQTLVGDAFTVADAYLLWALLLFKHAGIPLSDPLRDYLRLHVRRPAVARALALETPQALGEGASQGRRS